MTLQTGLFRPFFVASGSSLAQFHADAQPRASPRQRTSQPEAHDVAFALSGTDCGTQPHAVAGRGRRAGSASFSVAAGGISAGAGIAAARARLASRRANNAVF